MIHEQTSQYTCPFKLKRKKGFHAMTGLRKLMRVGILLIYLSCCAQILQTVMVLFI